LVLEEVENENAVAAIAQGIVTKVSEAVLLGDEEVFVGASIGIALYPKDAQDLKSLTKAADSAMYWSKEAGRGAFRFYDPKLDLPEAQDPDPGPEPA